MSIGTIIRIVQIILCIVAGAVLGEFIRRYFRGKGGK